MAEASLQLARGPLPVGWRLGWREPEPPVPPSRAIFTCCRSDIIPAARLNSIPGFTQQPVCTPRLQLHRNPRDADDRLHQCMHRHQVCQRRLLLRPLTRLLQTASRGNQHHPNTTVGAHEHTRPAH